MRGGREGWGVGTKAWTSLSHNLSTSAWGCIALWIVSNFPVFLSLSFKVPSQPRPQGFSFKKMGPTHFLREKPWGRG